MSLVKDLEAPTYPALEEFVRFYRANFDVTWRTLLRLGVEHRDCEDATQEVFTTACLRWNSLRDRALRRAWLFGITRRVAYRFRRTRARSNRREHAFAQVSSLAEQGVGADRRRDALDELTQFLDRLDERKRAVFVLGEIEQLTRQELGDALCINPNTAYSQLQAVRREFRACLGERQTPSRLLSAARTRQPVSESTKNRTLSVILAPVVASSTTSHAVAACFVGSAVLFVSAGSLGVALRSDVTSASTEIVAQDPAPSLGERHPSAPWITPSEDLTRAHRSSQPQTSSRPAQQRPTMSIPSTPHTIQTQRPDGKGSVASSKSDEARPERGHPAASIRSSGPQSQPVVPRVDQVDPAASTMAEELSLLRRAKEALNTGANQQALALTERHQQLFPQGVLKDVREGARFRALCSLGRKAEAQAVASGDFGASMVALGVGSSCD